MKFFRKSISLSHQLLWPWRVMLILLFALTVGFADAQTFARRTVVFVVSASSANLFDAEAGRFLKPVGGLPRGLIDGWFADGIGSVFLQQGTIDFLYRAADTTPSFSFDTHRVTLESADQTEVLGFRGQDFVELSYKGRPLNKLKFSEDIANVASSIAGRVAIALSSGTIFCPGWKSSEACAL